jgi:hypothetical protein
MFVAGPVLVLMFTVSCILTFTICSGGIIRGGITFMLVAFCAPGSLLYMFEDDSFLDLEFALNENRIVSNQLLYLVSLLACLIIVSGLPVRTGIMALAAIALASLIAMNATVLPNDICSTSARSSAWASTSVRPLTSTGRRIVSVLASGLCISW